LWFSQERTMIVMGLGAIETLYVTANKLYRIKINVRPP
jgi:hypothetical protein